MSPGDKWDKAITELINVSKNVWIQLTNIMKRFPDNVGDSVLQKKSTQYKQLKIYKSPIFFKLKGRQHSTENKKQCLSHIDLFFFFISGFNIKERVSKRVCERTKCKFSLFYMFTQCLYLSQTVCSLVEGSVNKLRRHGHHTDLQFIGYVTMGKLLTQLLLKQQQ